MIRVREGKTNGAQGPILVSGQDVSCYQDSSFCSFTLIRTSWRNVLEWLLFRTRFNGLLRRSGRWFKRGKFKTLAVKRESDLPWGGRRDRNMSRDTGVVR